MTRARPALRVLIFLGALLASTHPLPAPVTVLPEATPKPAPKPPKPSPAPKSTNAHGVPDGSYYHPTSNSNGEHGSSQQNNRFVVHGNTFDWFRTASFTVNDAGHRAGKRDRTVTCKMSGSISRKTNGTLSFKPNTAEIVSRSPSNLPDSKTDIATLRAQTKAVGFTLNYTGGRLVEVDSTSAWSPRN